MKLTFLFLFAGLMTVSASIYSQSTKLNLNLENATILEVFRQIEEQSEFAFIYKNDVIDVSRKVNVKVEGTSIEVILDEIFRDTKVNYEIVKKQIILTPDRTIPATIPGKEEGSMVQPQKEITGAVTDKSGLPIPGVAVLVKGTTIGTVTNERGVFNLSIPDNSQVLVFSFVGLKTQELPIGNSVSFSISMEEETVGLEEVVAVGYGVQKKASITGAISGVTMKELVQSPQANISNMLVGRLPGLFAVQRSGQPGDDQSTLRIRGVGTFTGVADPLILVDGIEQATYNNIDPNEIEALTILKDASATAVYGVRGANGVILITTKRGSVGRPQVSFTANYAVNQFTDVREMSNAFEYVSAYNEALKYDSYITGGYTPKFSEEAIAKFKSHEDPIFYPDMDWFETMYAKYSTQSQYNLSFSGGVKGVKYFASAGYYNQEGLFNEEITKTIEEFNAQPVYRRYNFRSNFDFDIVKRLTAKVNISSQIEERRGNTDNINRNIEIITKSNPINSPGIIDGKLITLGYEGPGGQVGPEFLLGSGYRRGYENSVNISVRLDYDLGFILNGLKTHGTISYNNFNSQDGKFSKSITKYEPVRIADNSIVYVPQGEESPFYYGESVRKYRREYAEFGFDYSKKIMNHNLGGLLLYNQSKLFDPNLAFLVPKGIQGVVGRVTYDYADRYLSEFNFGYNGSENFAEGKRFGFFPAFSLGWVVSEEPFFPENEVVSFFKIRGSWGTVGNDQIGGQRFLYMPSSYSYSNNFYYWGTTGLDFNGYRGSTEGKIGNPDVTWETSRKMNIGAEITLWRGRLRVTGDLFDERRENILASLGTVPTIVGANLPAFNLGKMKNSGFDGELTFNHKIHKLNYWVKANYTYARNEVLFKDEPTRTYAYQMGTGQRNGQSFGLIAEGLFNTWEEVNDPARPKSSWNGNKIQPGDIKYRDVNSDGIIDPDDQVPIGFSNFPDKTFGFSIGGNIKGFDFSVLFQGASDVSVNYSRHARYGLREEAGIGKYIYDRSWTQERYEQGLPIEFPHLAEGDTQQKHNYQNSTFWIRDASYLRLKNMELGYTLSPAALTRIGIKSARLFVNGNNLITWDNMFPGIDPESNVASTNWEPYPLTRTLNLGLNFKF